MSYDLMFYKKEGAAVSSSEIKDYLGDVPNIEGGENGLWGYENEDTGVYCTFAFSQPEISTTTAGFEPLGFSFNLNYLRPGFFGLEALGLVDELANKFDLYIYDPQGDNEPRKYSKEKLYEEWNAINRKTAGLPYGKKAPYLDTATSDNAWRHNFSKEQLEETAGEEFFIPTILFIQKSETDKVETVCTWTTGIPIYLPKVDWVMIQKGNGEMGLVGYEAVMKTLGSYFKTENNYKIFESSSAAVDAFNTLKIEHDPRTYGTGIKSDAFMNIEPTPEPAAIEAPNTITENQLHKLNAAVDKIKAMIRQVIVGQEQMIDLLITAILADGHVLIEGVPGVAKTLIAKLLAKTISAGFSRLQFTPDLMPSDVLGTNVYNFKTSEFEFRKGPIFSNIILVDEINRSPAKTQAALFEVMEERQITLDSVTRKMAPPFIVFATQNPIEQEGTYRLPEAQLDRFIYKIEVKYPLLAEEIDILKHHHNKGSSNDIDLINHVITAEELMSYQQAVKQVHIEEKLLEYIAKLVHRTRESKDIVFGGSPRASINLMNAAKATAAIRGRAFVTPDDILFVVKPVLRHRLILTPEREMEGVTTNAVIDQLTKSIEIPR
jgi:MoxR-like ATPase